MPTYDYYATQQQWQPNLIPSGAALLPSGQQYGQEEATQDAGVEPYRADHDRGAIQPYRGGQRAHRAASLARVQAGMAGGDAAAALHMYQSSRPFSRDRRIRRDQWRHAEEASIRADHFAEVITREVVLGDIYGWW